MAKGTQAVVHCGLLLGRSRARGKRRILRIDVSDSLGEASHFRPCSPAT